MTEDFPYMDEDSPVAHEFDMDEIASLKKLWNDDLENASLDGLAGEDVLALIHELTARRLVENLRDPMRATPGILQAARGFLRDNEVSGLDIPGSANDALKKALSELVPFKTGTNS